MTKTAFEFGKRFSINIKLITMFFCLSGATQSRDTLAITSSLNIV